MLEDGRILTAAPMDRLQAGRLGLRTYEKSKTSPGYTLFSTAFGYTEYLIDMAGMVVHTWPVTHSQLAEILPGGNLLVDDYGRGLKELTPGGEVVWSWEGDYHHDFARMPDGNTVLLVARKEEPYPGFYPRGLEPGEMRTDVVIEVDPTGEIVWNFPFGDHIEEIRREADLPWPVRYVYRDATGRLTESGNSDWAHTNTIEVLPDTPLGRRDDRFRAGNLLFSFRALDTIGVVDRQAEEVVWAWGLGTLDGQHQPTMVESGNILLFDNGTYRGHSKVVEMNPSTGEIVWEYEDRSGFFSPYRAGVQRLPNGNTLVCESDSGRIFEVTPGKEIVWDYWSPFLGQGPGNQGRHIYRATRYTEDQVEPVLSSRTERIVAVADAQRRALTSFRDSLRFYQAAFGGL